jgi:hypothetical protein
MHYFFFFVISIFSLTAWAQAQDILAPSLLETMKKQEAILQKNIREERKTHNTNTLIAIRRANAGRKIHGVSDSTIVSGSQEKSVTLKTTPPSIKKPTPSEKNTSEISWVDMDRVRDVWFSWYNTYRDSLGLRSYGHDPRLDTTAHDWNIVFAAEKWRNHHTRHPWDGYYNFPVIDKWFITRGINPKVINRAKHTENVGYGYYQCDQSDCTDEMIASIRTTWNFFLSEKWKSYDAHYRTIVQPYFTKMGFDIIVKPDERRYYIVIHFITE